MDIVHTVLDLLKVWLTILSDGIVFLNDNSGAFTVIFAFIVVIATVIYAVLTWRLISETRRLREAQTEIQNFIHENKRLFITTQSEYEYEREQEDEKAPEPACNPGTDSGA
jgi:hypothetical protein